MSVLVGFSPSLRGRGAVELGLVLARSLGQPLVVCCIVANRWESPSMARIDADDDRALRGRASAALDEGRAVVAGHENPPPQVEYVVGRCPLRWSTWRPHRRRSCSCSGPRRTGRGGTWLSAA